MVDFAWQPMTVAPKNAQWIIARDGDSWSKTPVLIHWAEGGGEEQPRFGPGWFYWNGYMFNEFTGKLTEWKPYIEG